MKVLNKNTDYAVRALLSLAGSQGVYMSAKTIATEQDIPYQFLRRLLQELIRHRLVVSREGASGGFMLKRDPDGIGLRELIEIFQGPVQVSECLFRKKLCLNRARCVLRHQILRIEQVVRDEFEKITIGSLLRDLADAGREHGTFPLNHSAPAECSHH
ncbi:MAG: Rrf2 family transcriptional regulator [Pelodictyon luteolum]|uniref:Rrf2 family transcriptional regulator n=1 Tax=Pelodictyon luteolum TaxID=1100 RepID=A0A165L489_PELLU|nr:Rrf2 family transcriptional regulator [Pelodictyon luteolum]KZK73553.1 MAG: Rrf2 family transcriptional regulator [Pelodictyon luteolum]